MRPITRSEVTLLYANQWYYTYRVLMTRVRYYARAVRFVKSKTNDNHQHLRGRCEAEPRDEGRGLRNRPF